MAPPLTPHLALLAHLPVTPALALPLSGRASVFDCRGARNGGRLLLLQPVFLALLSREKRGAVPGSLTWKRYSRLPWPPHPRSRPVTPLSDRGFSSLTLHCLPTPRGTFSTLCSEEGVSVALHEDTGPSVAGNRGGAFSV